MAGTPTDGMSTYDTLDATLSGTLPPKCMLALSPTKIETPYIINQCYGWFFVFQMHVQHRIVSLVPSSAVARAFAPLRAASDDPHGDSGRPGSPILVWSHSNQFLHNLIFGNSSLNISKYREIGFENFTRQTKRQFNLQYVFPKKIHRVSAFFQKVDFVDLKHPWFFSVRSIQKCRLTLLQVLFSSIAVRQVCGFFYLHYPVSAGGDQQCRGFCLGRGLEHTQK